MFEKAQSATPQQEVRVPGVELWHAGKNGSDEEPNPKKNTSEVEKRLLMLTRSFSGGCWDLQI